MKLCPSCGRRTIGDDEVACQRCLMNRRREVRLWWKRIMIKVAEARRRPLEEGVAGGV